MRKKLASLALAALTVISEGVKQWAATPEPTPVPEKAPPYLLTYEERLRIHKETLEAEEAGNQNMKVALWNMLALDDRARRYGLTPAECQRRSDQSRMEAKIRQRRVSKESARRLAEYLTAIPHGDWSTGTYRVVSREEWLRLNSSSLERLSSGWTKVAKPS
jgi:hypothetical protein